MTRCLRGPVSRLRGRRGAWGAPHRQLVPPASFASRDLSHYVYVRFNFPSFQGILGRT
jgi:hypothetical protein